MSINDHDENQEIQQNEQQEQKNQEPDYREQFLRLNADMQNFKRRVDKERSEWMLIAQADAIKSFFPVIDDLSRALDVSISQELPPEIKSWLDGLTLVQKNIQKKLQELEIEEIITTGKFDPELHEAMMHVDSPSHQSGDIVHVLSKGYTFKGKVLQYAKVSVAK
jgi:molecular chaperone GrpE